MYLFDSHAMSTMMKGGQVCKEWLEFTAASSFDGQRFCNSDMYSDMSAFIGMYWSQNQKINQAMKTKQYL